MSWEQWSKKELTSYRCLELNNDKVIQAFSSRSYGNMGLHTGDQASSVLKNREDFLNTFGLKLKNLVAAEQIHGQRVQTVSGLDKGLGAYSYREAFSKTDALITKERGVILSIFTADCLPIFIYDPTTPAVGIVHAGWRGTIQEIAKSAIIKMKQEFGTAPSDCRIAIGPAICGKCFRVGPEVAEKFNIVDPEVVSKDEQGFLVNLQLFNSHLCQSAGVPAVQIFSADFCTSCDLEQFFSYRAEGGTMGRMMGIIALQ